MDITKSGNVIKTNKIFNSQSVAFGFIYAIAFVVFLTIKQILKIAFAVSSTVALPVAFGVTMLGLFFCEKKYVFAGSINSKPLKQVLAYIFRCAVDFGFFKILDFALFDMLEFDKVVVYLFSGLLIFVFNLYFDRLIVFDNTQKFDKIGNTPIYRAFFANRFVLLAVALTVIINLFIFLQFGVYPFGDVTVLRMDLYHQYGPLFIEYYDRITNLDSFFYSWISGGGSSFLGNFFNYLSSPLSLIVLLFDKNQIGYAITTLVLVKGALSAGAFAYFLKESFGRHSYISASFGAFYALSGYFLAYYWNIMWIDGMIWLPLVALGIERIINQGKCRLYIISLSVLLFSTYYIGYMVCIFSVLYFFVYYVSHRGFDEVINEYSEKPKAITKFFNNRFVASAVKFGLSSLLVGALCAVFLLPVYFILQSCSATSDSFPSSIEQNFNLFDMLSSHLAGLETTIRSSGEDVLPNIYCGILPLILLPLYLINKKISLREKTAHNLLYVFLVISFNCNAVDFIWHGFHFPNDLPFRYSFIYVFVFLIMAFRCVMNLKGIDYKDIMFTGIAIMIVIMLFQKNPTNKITSFTIYASLAFVMVWTLVMLVIKKQGYSKFIIGITVVCMTFCEGIVADSNSYLFTQAQKFYVEKMDTVNEAVDYIKDNDKSFYRVEQTYLETRMDPCIYNYNGVSTFSSMAYETYSANQYSLGMYGNRVNSYTYNPQTPVYNMMYALKYFIKDSSSLDLSDRYYSKIYTTTDEKKTPIYENKYYLPIAFEVSTTMEDWDNSEGNPFDVQEDWLNKATGASNVFVPVEYVQTDCYNAECDDVIENGTYFVDSIEEGAGGCIDIHIKSVKDSNVYVYIDSSELENVNYYWNDGINTTYQSIETPYILDLGFHNAGDEIKASIDLNGVSSTSASFDIYAYNIDNDVFESAYEMLSLGQLKVTNYSDTVIEGKLNAGFDGYLYTSIPYDEGWNIYIDGQKVKTFSVGDCQLATNVKHGEHTIKMVYTPKGLRLGIAISALAWLLIIIGAVLSKVLKRRKFDTGFDEKI